MKSEVSFKSNRSCSRKSASIPIRGKKSSMVNFFYDLLRICKHSFKPLIFFDVITLLQFCLFICSRSFEQDVVPRDSWYRIFQSGLLKPSVGPTTSPTWTADPQSFAGGDSESNRKSEFDKQANDVVRTTTTTIDRQRNVRLKKCRSRHDHVRPSRCSSRRWVGNFYIWRFGHRLERQVYQSGWSKHLQRPGIRWKRRRRRLWTVSLNFSLKIELFPLFRMEKENKHIKNFKTLPSELIYIFCSLTKSSSILFIISLKILVSYNYIFFL